MGEMFSGSVSVQKSNLNAARTKAAVARLAVALERQLKTNCPINKNPNKRGGTLRASIKAAITLDDLNEGVSISVTAADYVKYVIGGTTAHKISPKTAKTLAFMWSTSAQTTGVAGTGLRIASRLPISGYASKYVNDLRRLVRVSDLAKGGSQVFYPYVNHPGATANDFIPESIAAIGPDIQAFADAVGADLADDVMNALSTAFGTQSVRTS